MIDERLRVAEGRIERLRRELAAGEDAIRALQQGLRAAMMMRGQGGGASSAPLYCKLTAALAAAGALPSGSPASIGSQTVYLIASGAFSEKSSSAVVYNGMPDAIASGATVIVLPNADGSYSVIAVAC